MNLCNFIRTQNVRAVWIFNVYSELSNVIGIQLGTTMIWKKCMKICYAILLSSSPSLLSSFLILFCAAFLYYVRELPTSFLLATFIPLFFSFCSKYLWQRNNRGKNGHFRTIPDLILAYIKSVLCHKLNFILFSTLSTPHFHDIFNKGWGNSWFFTDKTFIANFCQSISVVGNP